MIRRVDRRAAGQTRGATLLELMVAMAIMGIVSALAAPSYHRCIEQGRADLAAGQLRALWVAERVWRLDHPGYADPASLAAAGLIESGLASGDGPFRYEVDHGADPEAFLARAVRVGGGPWSGSIEIDASGTIMGSIHRAGSAAIRPGYQFREH